MSCPISVGRGSTEYQGNVYYRRDLHDIYQLCKFPDSDSCTHCQWRNGSSEFGRLDCPSSIFAEPSNGWWAMRKVNWESLSRLMAGRPGLPTGLQPIAALLHLQALAHETGGFRALSHIAALVWCGKGQTLFGHDGMPPQELQKSLWQQFFTDPTRWWDNRWRKPTPRHPDFRHKNSNLALWLDNLHKPAWVDMQLATWEASMKLPPDTVSTSVEVQGSLGRLGAHEHHMQAEKCREICENGRITDAVDALNLLVQGGYHVDNNLFYCVLKRCIAHKDLVLGSRVHTLTIKSGFEGDAFLATHLIRLYASNGRLEEAMRVFTKVSTPDAYNWATIIFAFARHGDASQAIQLYRRMHKSTVKPTDYIYLAVLKACAVAGDLSAGKEVHAHILGTPGKPDVFVHTGLVNMYAKCGSLEDARRVFNKLLHKDAVTWTAMIAAYAQQGMGQESLALYNSMQQEGINPPNSATFVCLLQACAIVGEQYLHQGRLLHARIEGLGMQDNVVVCGSLVNMYAKCGSIEDARRVFDRLPDKNVVTWNTMLAGYAQQGMGQEALCLYSSMQYQCLTPPDSVTYVSLLQACASIGVGSLHQGKQFHAQIEEQGVENDVILGGSLVNMYAKCGSLEGARGVFDSLPERNVVAWNAMLAGYVQEGLGQEALTLYSSMQQENATAPNPFTFGTLLQACASVGAGALQQGEQLHAQIEEQGLQNNVVVGNSLVNMYAKCGSLGKARNVFDCLPEKNVVTWNVLLAGYVNQGQGQEALGLSNSMQQEGVTPPDSVTYVCLLQACAAVGAGALHQGKQLHAQIEEQGLHHRVVLGGSIINMYSKCGSLMDARTVFDRLPERNVVTWNVMITVYAQQGMCQEALSLYLSMQQQEGSPPPNYVTFVCLLQACASVGLAALQQGRQLHAHIEELGVKVDVVLGGSLVNMYAKCGSLEDARKVFEKLPDKNVMIWNALFAGYAQQGMGQEALSLYNNMQQEGLTPDLVTFLCLLQACASVGVGALHQGMLLHRHIKEQGLQGHVVLGGSLVNMYGKCSSLENARCIFDSLPERNVVTWTAMIACYAQQGMGEEALSVYNAMQQEGLTPPDSVTFVCLLQACAFVAALPLGKQLHAQIMERGLQSDRLVGAALVNMYAKCGSMFDSQQVFDSLPERSIDAWNALTGGYARQGDSKAVFDLVEKIRLEGIQPDGITFVSLLTVCSHVGLIEKGRNYFEAMSRDYCISPAVEHYTCMMDLLGRAGHVNEALQMVKSMPFPPNAVMWHTLLGACRKWKNVEVGQQAFEGAVSIDGKDASSYVLMSNIYASAEMWEEAKEMRARRLESGAWKKKPGQSWWIDLSGVVHSFIVGEKQHTECEVSMQCWNS